MANFRKSLGDRGGATDHGDTASEATRVAVRSTTRGLLEADDVDYFRINVPRSGVLRVETTGATDTRGELASAEDNTDFRRASDDDGGEDANFLIESQVKAGAYIVEVRGTGGAQGAYRLRVSLDWLREDDHGDTAAEATWVGTPSSTDGVLGVEDADYFRIDLAEAATLRVETKGSVDTYGKLAWLDGRAVLEDDDSGENQNFRIETALPAGAYILEVRGFSAQPATIGHSNRATGFYTLDVGFGPDGGAEDDHAGAPGAATPVAVPSATRGELEAALDVDYFRIELPAVGTLRVETTGDTDTRGRLLRAATAGDHLFRNHSEPDELFSNDDGCAGGNFLIEENLGRGAYLVEVRGFRGATTGAYELAASFTARADDHGDTAAAATVLALPSYKSGRINAPFDVDYFRLTLPEPGTLAVSLLEGPYHSAASLIQAGGVLADRWGTDPPINMAKLPAGVYFVAVRTVSPTLGPFRDVFHPNTYRLHVAFTPQAPDDHGDTHVTATSIDVPSTTAGELEAGDVDVFRFDLPQAGTLRLATTGTTATRGSLFVQWRYGWWSPAEDDGAGRDGNFEIDKAVAAGRYFVEVRGSDEETTGAYSLDVALGPAEPRPPDDHGDTAAKASVAGLGSTSAGELHDARDADVFRINVPQEGVLRVETTGVTDTEGALLSADGTVLAEDDNGGALLNFRIDKWVRAGAYFAKVTGWDGRTGAYALRVAFTPTGQLTNTREVPLFLSARETPIRQSVLRVLNRSGEAGTVNIRAVDDSANVRGPVTLTMGAGHAAHFDSEDLEAGNPAKGLSAGVGPGEGDWRLRLTTVLDIEALAYVRTQDGFLTAMHDTVPAVDFRHAVPLFNPASNRQQASRLRLINRGEQDAEVAISAVDDLGAAAPGGTVALTIPAGAARAVTAQQLEGMEPGDATLRGRLGDGAGKWRLAVSANRPVVVMSLVESPDGGLANVSTRPATADALPLLLAGHRDPLRGFARIVNASDVAGEVVIHATDDAGRRLGPVALTVGAGRAAHFNSADLEQGNAAKGLSGAVGSGVGSWRLELATSLDIEPLAYARGPGGFLAATHDIAPSAGQTHRVATFNAAGSDPASELRLVNAGAEDAAITIAGRDDAGSPAPEGSVSLTLPAGESRNVTAQQLEEGAADLAGRFGDGHGRWRLTIVANAPIQVMNLLRSTTGRYGNLSTSPVPPAQ